MTKKVENKKKIKNYIAIVLDRSGSMDPIREETISHFNEQVEAIKDQFKGMTNKISLITFNHEIKEVFFNKGIRSLKKLTKDDYRPDGMTAMLDAVGETINRLQKECKDLETDENASALMVIISDGRENSSKEFDRSQIAEMIQKCQDTDKWTFSYIGANQDLSKITKDLNIPIGNVMAFQRNAEGMEQLTCGMVKNYTNYAAGRCAGQTSSANFTEPAKDSSSTAAEPASK